jgi:hypothetical protein
MKTRIDTIPDTIPYLRVDKHDDAFPAIVSAGNKLRVGISWAGNPKNSNDLRRSCPFEMFASLLSLENVALFSLQFGARKKELDESQYAGRITDLTSEIKDFYDSAAMMQQLDLILTVDSAPAHLAGALGRKVWMVIPYFPDWRWLLYREDSPWYPTMRIFRQPQPGDWTSVFSKVKNALLSEFT